MDRIAFWERFAIAARFLVASLAGAAVALGVLL